MDDDTVVFVADPSLGGNILNFNVGGNIDLRIPRASQQNASLLLNMAENMTSCMLHGSCALGKTTDYTEIECGRG